VGKINTTEYVQKQYQKSDGLHTRISIHEKYSTNKMGLSNWYFTKYEMNSGMRVLELGCGTGSMWMGHEDVIEKCGELVLSDFSTGMLEKAKENIGDISNVSYRVIDIQDIPYEDESFDIVIANYMLYHVPDIKKALSEVRRVLKSGGLFYAGTTGENGIMETIVKYLNMPLCYKNTFSLENGLKQLESFFSEIHIERYIDLLAVTNMDDLMEYIYSGITFSNECKLSRDEVKAILTSHMENGVLVLPKEPGMFVARK